MKIQFTNNFTEIAKSGDATHVGVTVANMMARTRGIIECMYPDAEINIKDLSIMKAHCIVTDVQDGELVELEEDAAEIVYYYNECLMPECWV